MQSLFLYIRNPCLSKPTSRGSEVDRDVGDGARLDGLDVDKGGGIHALALGKDQDGAVRPAHRARVAQPPGFLEAGVGWQRLALANGHVADELRLGLRAALRNASASAIVKVTAHRRLRVLLSGGWREGGGGEACSQGIGARPKPTASCQLLASRKKAAISGSESARAEGTGM